VGKVISKKIYQLICLNHKNSNILVSKKNYHIQKIVMKERTLDEHRTNLGKNADSTFTGI